MDLRNHGSKFFDSLDELIMVVDKPEELFKMLHDIGVRHKRYEVKSEHIQVDLINLYFILLMFFFNRPLLMDLIIQWNLVYETNGRIIVRNLFND
jgi:hypothetical protein